MTDDEIIEMIKQSDLGFLLGDNWMMHHELVAFAKLVAAKEREAYAKFFDDNDTNIFWGSEAARFIRARGEQVATNNTSKERVDEIQKQRHEANVQKFLGAPQPEQEPVEIYRNQCADGSRCLHGCHTNEPCYTTPPQRKPLTDEQIDEEFKLYASKFDTSSDKWLDMGADDYFKAGFKAAHGIKENKHDKR